MNLRFAPNRVLGRRKIARGTKGYLRAGASGDQGVIGGKSFEECRCFRISEQQKSMAEHAFVKVRVILAKEGGELPFVDLFAIAKRAAEPLK